MARGLNADGTSRVSQFTRELVPFYVPGENTHLARSKAEHVEKEGFSVS